MPITDQVSSSKGFAQLAKMQHSVEGGKLLGCNTFSDFVHYCSNRRGCFKLFHPLVSSLRVQIVTYGSLGCSKLFSCIYLRKMILLDESLGY